MNSPAQEEQIRVYQRSFRLVTFLMLFFITLRLIIDTTVATDLSNVRLQMSERSLQVTVDHQPRIFFGDIQLEFSTQRLHFSQQLLIFSLIQLIVVFSWFGYLIYLGIKSRGLKADHPSWRDWFDKTPSSADEARRFFRDRIVAYISAGCYLDCQMWLWQGSEPYLISMKAALDALILSRESMLFGRVTDACDWESVVASDLSFVREMNALTVVWAIVVLLLFLWSLVQYLFLSQRNAAVGWYPSSTEQLFRAATHE